MRVSFSSQVINRTVPVYNRNTNQINRIQNKSIQTVDLPVIISFEGNSKKHTNQIASIACEYQGILNPIYKAGGLGSVAGEASIAFHDHGGADIRTFVPYYSPDNKWGGIKVKTPNDDDDAKKIIWKTPKGPEEGYVKAVNTDYKLKDGESFVVHDFITEGVPTQYFEITDTGIKGDIEMIDKHFRGMEKIPYHMYQVKGTGNDIKGRPTVYVMHTRDTASFPKCYHGYAREERASDLSDVSYAKTYRAIIDALPKMDNEKFGNFNPASYWLHDRQVFSILPVIAEKSAEGDEYFNGLKIHNTYHNAGRAYQGHFSNPFEFMRLIGTRADFEKIQKLPPNIKSFLRVCEWKISDSDNANMQKWIKDSLTHEEARKLHLIFDPIIGNFKDEYDEYNGCMIPLEGARLNPNNISAGTVSITYSKEMKDEKTKDIADGLTSCFASDDIKTIDIVNGSTPANLYLDRAGTLGNNNGFTKEKMEENFIPLYNEDGTPKQVQDLMNAKQANKKFLISEIANASKLGSRALGNLFFNQEQIGKGSTVLGGLSDYKEGDILFFGWGRPDEQKGFPTSIEAVKQYLMSDAPEEEKLHAKFIFGAGPWPTGNEDFKDIIEGINEIEDLKGGKYKGQIVYVNGFTSNRIVACADYALITSVYEPCGITPLESYSAGTPVISHATGGSPDFITSMYDKNGNFNKNATGILTEHPFLIDPSVMHIYGSISYKEKMRERRKFLSKEDADCINKAMKLRTNEPEKYAEMVANCLKLKIDWHNNKDFNGGRSAMQRYFEDAWKINENLEEISARDERPLKTLKWVLA